MVGENAGGEGVRRFSDVTDELEETGRVWLRGALIKFDLDRFGDICAVEGKPGLRLDATTDLITATGGNSTLAGLVRRLVPNAHPVRFVVFNKSDSSNWLVPWHQDRVIAVAEKLDVEGYTNWSNKSGVWHCEAPIDVLSSMVFVRIHLDDTDEENGCIELAHGTHRLGFIAAGEADAIADRSTVEACKARRGDILIVKALTLHRSKPSRNDKPRRTLLVGENARWRRWLKC